MSMLGSTVLGGVMSIVAQRGQAEQEKQKMLMQRAGFAAKQTDKADVNVIYQIVSEVDSGWWIFGSSYETSVWKEGNSIFITSLQSHTIFSIIGLYFGGSLTRK